MKDESHEFDPIQCLIDALNFYAKQDNYWSAPLELTAKYCRRTLHDVQEAKKSNKILNDRGYKAHDALMKFDEHLRLQSQIEECDKRQKK